MSTQPKHTVSSVDDKFYLTRDGAELIYWHFDADPKAMRFTEIGRVRFRSEALAQRVYEASIRRRLCFQLR
jgi:hypothetical protein